MDQPAILVVDDDAGLLRLMQKALEREGLNVVTANSGRKALEWLNTNQPELMLLDLKLQDMEGMEVIRFLNQQERSIPFMVITGQGDERVAVEMMKSGAMDYLVKDTNFHALVPVLVHRALQQVHRDRKLAEAEAALRKEHAFISAVLATTDALVVVLNRTGAIVRFNRACEQLTGYAQSEVLGKPPWDLFLPEEQRERIQQVFSRIVSGHHVEPQEVHWLTRSGDARLITWSSNVLNAPNGDVEFVIGAGIDVTERKHLERQLLEISDLEQRRLGQDLHDGLCQQLAGVEFMSQALEQKLTHKARQEAAAAAQIAALIRETIAQTRGLAKGLSPVIEDPEGLMSALKVLTENTKNLFRVDCSFHCEMPVLLEDNSAATHLFRIAQEATNNAIRHGRAKRIEIHLSVQAQNVTLRIRDYGTGLPNASRLGKGMGLRIMDYRARTIGGSLEIRAEPSGGTTVACSIRPAPTLSQPKASHEERKKIPRG